MVGTDPTIDQNNVVFVDNVNWTTRDLLELRGQVESVVQVELEKTAKALTDVATSIATIASSETKVRRISAFYGKERSFRKIQCSPEDFTYVFDTLKISL